MIICLATIGKNLDSLLATHFNKSKYFIFVDLNRQELYVVQNKFDRSVRYLVAGEHPDVIITSNIDAGDFIFLEDSGIKIISGVFGLTAKKALDKYKNGIIKEAKYIPGAGKGKVL